MLCATNTRERTVFDINTYLLPAASTAAKASATSVHYIVLITAAGLPKLSPLEHEN